MAQLDASPDHHAYPARASPTSRNGRREGPARWALNSTRALTKRSTEAAFQKALDAAAQAGGATVQAGRGNFFFAGHLNVPPAVMLAGIWESVPAHNGLRDRGLPKPTDDGTTFFVTENSGQEDGPAFITLNHNSTLKGVVIYYPNQKVEVANNAPAE